MLSLIPRYSDGISSGFQGNFKWYNPLKLKNKNFKREESVPKSHLCLATSNTEDFAKENKQLDLKTNVCAVDNKSSFHETTLDRIECSGLNDKAWILLEVSGIFQCLHFVNIQNCCQEVAGIVIL